MIICVDSQVQYSMWINGITSGGQWRANRWTRNSSQSCLQIGTLSGLMKSQATFMQSAWFDTYRMREPQSLAYKWLHFT